jgi:hypothetical protein
LASASTATVAAGIQRASRQRARSAANSGSAGSIALRVLPDQPAAPQEKEVSFEKQPRRSGYGSHLAPFSGLHGWYWENEGAEPVTITLSSAGYFAQAIEVVVGSTPHATDRIPNPGGADPKERLGDHIRENVQKSQLVVSVINNARQPNHF